MDIAQYKEKFRESRNKIHQKEENFATLERKRIRIITKENLEVSTIESCNEKEKVRKRIKTVLAEIVSLKEEHKQLRLEGRKIAIKEAKNGFNDTNL